MAQLNYDAAIAQRQEAIRRNRAAFAEHLTSVVQDHRGEYALLREGEIIGIYASAADALQTAMRLFPNDVGYSVEKIEPHPEPIYMGMYADVVVSSKG